jgi:hypothetical protein
VLPSGTPDKVFGEPFQTVGGEKFLLFGMAATTPDNPVYLYEELIEPILGAGDVSCHVCSGQRTCQ